jgi:hypothetical protein
VSNSVVRFHRNDRNLFRHVAIVASVIFSIALLSGCDSRQHLVNSVAFQVTASADSKAVVPQGWRRTKFGWEHTSTWNLAAAEAAPPSLQEWIDRTSRRNPHWTNNLLSKIRSLSPITIALAQIALIGLILGASSRFDKSKKD